MDDLFKKPGLSSIDEFSEKRLWKTLDTISKRLMRIESKLSEIGRLDERISNHGRLLSQHADRLDAYDKRIHEAELWQASCSAKQSISNLQKETSYLTKKINYLESCNNIDRGHRDVGKMILQFVVGILSAVLIYGVTTGKWSGQ